MNTDCGKTHAVPPTTTTSTRNITPPKRFLGFPSQFSAAKKQSPSSKTSSVQVHSGELSIPPKLTPIPPQIDVTSADDFKPSRVALSLPTCKPPPLKRMPIATRKEKRSLATALGGAEETVGNKGEKKQATEPLRKRGRGVAGGGGLGADKTKTTETSSGDVGGNNVPSTSTNTNPSTPRKIIQEIFGPDKSKRSKGKGRKRKRAATPKKTGKTKVKPGKVEIQDDHEVSAEVHDELELSNENAEDQESGLTQEEGITIGDEKDEQTSEDKPEVEIIEQLSEKDEEFNAEGKDLLRLSLTPEVQEDENEEVSVVGDGVIEDEEIDEKEEKVGENEKEEEFDSTVEEKPGLEESVEEEQMTRSGDEIEKEEDPKSEVQDLHDECIDNDDDDAQSENSDDDADGKEDEFGDSILDYKIQSEGEDCKLEDSMEIEETPDKVEIDQKSEDEPEEPNLPIVRHASKRKAKQVAQEKLKRLSQSEGSKNESEKIVEKEKPDSSIDIVKKESQELTDTDVEPAKIQSRRSTTEGSTKSGSGSSTAPGDSESSTSTTCSESVSGGNKHLLVDRQNLNQTPLSLISEDDFNDGKEHEDQDRMSDFQDQKDSDVDSTYSWKPVRAAAAAALEQVTKNQGPGSTGLPGDADSKSAAATAERRARKVMRHKGRSRRTMQFKSSRSKRYTKQRLHPYEAQPSLLNIVYDHGYYFQEGDIVTVALADESLLYGQIRGILIDHHGEISAGIQWIGPKHEAYSNMSFHPRNYYIRYDIPERLIKIEYVNFIMHLHPDYFYGHPSFQRFEKGTIYTRLGSYLYNNLQNEPDSSDSSDPGESSKNSSSAASTSSQSKSTSSSKKKESLENKGQQDDDDDSSTSSSSSTDVEEENGITEESDEEDNDDCTVSQVYTVQRESSVTITEVSDSDEDEGDNDDCAIIEEVEDSESEPEEADPQPEPLDELKCDEVLEEEEDEEQVSSQESQ